MWEKLAMIFQHNAEKLAMIFQHNYRAFVFIFFLYFSS